MREAAFPQPWSPSEQDWGVTSEDRGVCVPVGRSLHCRGSRRRAVLRERDGRAEARALGLVGPQKSGRVEEEGRHHEADVPGAVWGGGCGMNEKPLD